MLMRVKDSHDQIERTESVESEGSPFSSPKRFDSRVRILIVFGFGFLLGIIAIGALNSHSNRTNNSKYSNNIRTFSTKEFTDSPTEEDPVKFAVKAAIKVPADADLKDSNKRDSKSKTPIVIAPKAKPELIDGTDAASYWKLQNSIGNEISSVDG